VIEQSNLSNMDAVQFEFVDEEEVDGGFTSAEVDAFLHTPIVAAATPTINAAESLYSKVNTGGDTVPWRIVSNSGRCGPSKPYAVVKESDGSVAGCHETRADATAQLRALYANESDMTLVAAGADCGCDDKNLVAANIDSPEVAWEGPLVVEGVETGDSRMFSANSLTWAELPVPLMYQRVTSHGGMSDESVNVGRIDRIWRDGNVIMGAGVLDLADPNGVDAARKIRNKYLRGVSIDADSVKESDVELVYADVDPNASEEEQLMAMMAAPELTIFHSARIRGTTLVNVPAFVEASINLIDDQVLVAAMIALSRKRKYVRDAQGRFDDVPNVGNIGGGGGDSTSRETRSLPHVGDHDSRATELARRLESDEGVSVFPDDNDDEFNELDKADLESDEGLDEIRRTSNRRRRKSTVPNEGDYSTPVLTASGHTITIPDVPDASWFEEPSELPPIGALWVTDEGRVFGIVGPSGVAHRAFKGRRVTIPMGNVDYSAWMNRPTIVRGGDRIATGLITMNCGHMSPYGSTDPVVRMAHYENSCSVAARVRIGESKKLGAPWIAGVLMPMDSTQLQAFMACQLSGDWAPHRERHGWREFVAALTVPVPGFARATTTTRVRVEDGVIVASAVPIRPWSESPTVTQSHRTELASIRDSLRGTPELSNRQALAAIRQNLHTPA
jgi:hypothetical protein